MAISDGEEKKRRESDDAGSNEGTQERLLDSLISICQPQEGVPKGLRVGVRISPKYGSVHFTTICSYRL